MDVRSDPFGSMMPSATRPDASGMVSAFLLRANRSNRGVSHVAQRPSMSTESTSPMCSWTMSEAEPSTGSSSPTTSV